MPARSRNRRVEISLSSPPVAAEKKTASIAELYRQLQTREGSFDVEIKVLTLDELRAELRKLDR